MVAGAGGPLGHALEVARSAADAGADALLVLPPYLVSGPQAGLAAYVEAIADASPLPVVVYHRGNAQYSVDTVRRLAANPKVVGFKDGVGDIGAAQLIVRAVAETGRDAGVLQRTPHRRAHAGRLPRHRHPAVLVRRLRDGARDRQRLLPRVCRRRRGPAPRTARRLLRAARAAARRDARFRRIAHQGGPATRRPSRRRSAPAARRPDSGAGSSGSPGILDAGRALV